MDINKRDSRCNSRGRLDMANNYSEQFSDSSSNNGMQHTIKTANSPCEEESTQNVQKADSNSAAREGDIDTLVNSSGSSLSSPNSKKSLSKQVSLSKIKPNTSSSKSIRDEQDIKKEDASLSPQNVSPLDFVPSSGQSNCDNDDNNGTQTHNKTSNLSPLSCEKNIPFPRSGGCNEMDERPTSASLVISSGNPSNLESGCSLLSASISPKTSSDGFGSGVSNIPRNMIPFNGNLTKFNCSSQGESQGTLNSGVGASSEYMQQQNHVFVFSTQLANKSAEAVVGGQFPTIIAYHCMQPSTKLFLEDFLKNPAKTSKMQRQYSLNIMNVMQSGSSGPGSQPYWLNDCNSSGKFSHRLALRSNVGVNKTNPGWDQAPDQVCATTNSLDILNNTDNFDNTKSAICGVKVEDKSSIPSLQGVKVPDENLTPQQRQHREEQLAKLKKMNKFLFPENEGNDFHTAPPETVANSLPGSSADVMHNSAGNCSDVPNKMYQPTANRNISANVGKQSAPGQGNANLDSMSSEMMPTGGDSSNMGVMQSNKHGCISKMNTSSLNMIKTRGQCDVANEQSSNSVHETNPDMNPSFNMNSCPSSETETVRGPSNMNMPQEEWAKFQNNPYHDGFKNRHSNAIHAATGTGMSGGPHGPGGQQNASLSRSLSIGVAGYGMQSRPNAGPNSNNRNNNGPPPPYHQTQRSASVPIATQSPTNVNSNNPNADMPLPSPQGGSRAPFGVSTPPNAEVTNSSSVITNPTHTAPTSISGMTSGNIMSSSILNSMTSNPLHTLSHISSPREIECIESAHKLKRSSPQKFKGPPMNDMPDNTCMEAKYANFALNYPTCGMPPGNAQNMRQNMQQMPSQFCRRIDNIPLNPNCNRINQNKTTSGFDPISSLAQMSQQLTGSSMGLSTIGAGNNVTGGHMDGELMAGHSGRTNNDHSMDHCNQISNSNNIGMSGLSGSLGRPTGQFPSDINNMLCGETGSMDQRMLNGKMCVPNFNPNALNGVGLRDTNIGCNDMMSNRPMNRRMPTNFDNFNMNPNIHVKVSAPNTIQYMPARSQNLNMRVPPSIEFFQRYSNPQIMGNVGVGHPGGHVHSDIANPNMMNLFGNCNQMPTGIGQLSGSGGFDQNELEVEGNLISNDDYMNVR